MKNLLCELITLTCLSVSLTSTSMTVVIALYGYPSESHEIKTADGYLVTVHRIPHGIDPAARRQQRGVVLLQHGLLSSSADWVLTGPNAGLGFLLADQGYDVWMGNARGNTYSSSHTKLCKQDSKFWNFTWHEMAIYDLPAVIDYILDKTQQQDLFYIGHSMGTTMFFAMASSKPEYNSKIRAMFALAPVAYVSHMSNPMKRLAPLVSRIKIPKMPYLSDWFPRSISGTDFVTQLSTNVLPNRPYLATLAKYGCLYLPGQDFLCENVLSLYCALNKYQLNKELIPIILSHIPAGASTKTIIHYAQEINSGKFQQFDYGEDGNMELYNSSTPPEYNLVLVTTPVTIYYADKDCMSSIQDVNQLCKELPNQKGKHLVGSKGFSHLDFLWGKDAKLLIYDHLLNEIEKYNPTLQQDNPFNPLYTNY